ncbi:MAG: hypothetical protein EXQ86_09400 [Rhodospirillales bacterium]|nr:hypothetical protein [Rhodospirillales bacterium]
MKRFFAPPDGFPTFCFLLYLAAEGTERSILVVIATLTDARTVGEHLLAIPAGFIADAAVALLLSLPLFVIAHHSARRRWSSRVTPLVNVFAALIAVFLAFENISDILFWNEFQSRFNGIAIN